MIQPVIELRGIGRRFPGVVANHDVSLSVAAGQVHAIVGENGAGKSTLMEILYGLQRPDEGEVRIDGRPVRLDSPADAIAHGIGMVHQHLMLADNLTVLENIVLGSEPIARGGRLDVARARAAITAIAARHGLPLDPVARVGDLSVGARQRVEIVKVLYRGARILILDEPTAVLVPQEVDELLRTLRALRDVGFTILFISHRLDEVLSVADVITVMRAGTTVVSVQPRDTDVRRLAELMVGSALPEPARHGVPPRAGVALQLRGVTSARPDARESLHDLSLTLHEGEIVGVAGVEGNGQSELIEVVLGIVVPSAGTIALGGHDITHWPTGERRALGLAAIPPDRRSEGLLLDAPLWENRILGHQLGPPLARGPWIDRGVARAGTRAIVLEADVRTPSIDVAASALSGGNQQKLIVGRELAGDPRVLIAAHPTRGVDVRAQAAIWARLVAARDAGLAVLLVSADLSELIGLSDRIVVMLRGRITGELDPRTVTPEALGGAMTGIGP